MVLDMYLIWELLAKYPQLEIKIEAAPTLDGPRGLQIRVISYEDLTQKFVILDKRQMTEMRGMAPLMDIVTTMIKTVANGEGY